tara:strand:- start:2092 stop:2394 length:303 start_codon:yes stop_codon:yes gene_type:complete
VDDLDYSNEHARCKVSKNDTFPDGVMEVSSVETDKDFRGQGYATKLMQKVCKVADNDTIVLVLKPDVHSFYERFGFQKIQDSPVLLARQPIYLKKKSKHD